MAVFQDRNYPHYVDFVEIYPKVERFKLEQLRSRFLERYAFIIHAGSARWEEIECPIIKQQGITLVPLLPGVFPLEGAFLSPLLEQTLLVLRDKMRILVPGSGSGIDAVALVLNHPEVRVDAFDNYAVAVANTRATAKLYGVSGRISVWEADGNLENTRGPYDAIVMNAPVPIQGPTTEPNEFDPDGKLICSILTNLPYLLVNEGALYLMQANAGCSILPDILSRYPYLRIQVLSPSRLVNILRISQNKASSPLVSDQNTAALGTAWSHQKQESSSLVEVVRDNMDELYRKTTMIVKTLTGYLLDSLRIRYRFLSTIMRVFSKSEGLSLESNTFKTARTSPSSLVEVLSTIMAWWRWGGYKIMLEKSWSSVIKTILSFMAHWINSPFGAPLKFRSQIDLTSYPKERKNLIVLLPTHSSAINFALGLFGFFIVVDLFIFYDAIGIVNAGTNIFFSYTGEIITDNLIKCQTTLQQFQDLMYHYPMSFYAWFAMAYIWIYGNMFQQFFHFSSFLNNNYDFINNIIDVTKSQPSSSSPVENIKPASSPLSENKFKPAISFLCQAIRAFKMRLLEKFHQARAPNRTAKEPIFRKVTIVGRRR